MIEVLQFIFQDFWHFAGTWVLLMAICPWNKISIGFKTKDKINFYKLTGPELKSAMEEAPSVPAVPLDKLCVWLAKFGCPCEINEGMCDDAHGVDRCIGIFNSSAFCWQYWLTKMMEEQDALD